MAPKLKERIVEASYVELEPNEHRQRRRANGCLCAISITAIVIAVACGVGLLVFVLGGAGHHVRHHDHHHRKEHNKTHEKEWISFSRPEEYGDNVPWEEAEVDVDEQKIVHINTVYGAESTTLYLYHKGLIVSRDMSEEECLILPLETTFEDDVAKLRQYQKSGVAPRIYEGDIKYGEEIGEKELHAMGEEIKSLCEDVPTFHATVDETEETEVKKEQPEATEKVPEVEEVKEESVEDDKTTPLVMDVVEEVGLDKSEENESDEEKEEEEKTPLKKEVQVEGGEDVTEEEEGSGSSEEWTWPDYHSMIHSHFPIGPHRSDYDLLREWDEWSK